MPILGFFIAHIKKIQWISLIHDHHEGINDINFSSFNEYKASAVCFDKTLAE